MRVWLVLAVLALGGCREPGEANAAQAANVASPILSGPGWPELTGRVVDMAELLAPDEEARLSLKSETLEKEVGPQFVVVTVASLNGLPIEKYSIDLARHWGLGSKERNDGLMLLVAPSERKVRIEVGTGLERRVTDPFAARVIREDMNPHFSKGAFAAGIEEGADSLIERLRSKASDKAIAAEDRVVQ